MATINIPAPLRPLTGGATLAEVEASTLGEVIERLEERFPGISARLVEGERVRPGMAVFVNGAQAPPQLTTRTPADAEIYFAPAIAGGCQEPAIQPRDIAHDVSGSATPRPVFAV